MFEELNNIEIKQEVGNISKPLLADGTVHLRKT